MTYHTILGFVLLSKVTEVKVEYKFGPFRNHWAYRPETWYWYVHTQGHTTPI
jgi:hypothetical protein